jgi:AcrR family transcriptional regulator
MTSIRHNGQVDTSPDDAYLDAAREAILAVGWSRTTLTDVARRAGVSRMTLYRRWPAMPSMLADLMTREWTRTVRGHEGDVVATVRALRENPLLRKIVEVDPEVLLPYLLERRGRSQDLVLGALTEALRAGQQAGTVRAGDPALMAQAVVLACQGFLLSAHTMAGAGAGAAVDALDRELGRLVEGYLRP